MRSEVLSRTLQEATDVASSFETRSGCALVGRLGCGERG